MVVEGLHGAGCAVDPVRGSTLYMICPQLHGRRKEKITSMAMQNTIRISVRYIILRNS